MLNAETPLPQFGWRRSQGGRSLRVFVVENHDDTRILLCMLLQQMGHTVRSAATMREALRAIPQNNYDILISDIGLPDGDGWELMHRLERARPPFAIAMSGRGMQGDYAKSRAAGYRHHLVKPTGPEQLADILDHAAHELQNAPEPA